MASGEKDMFSAATAQLTFHNFLEKMRHPSAVDLVRSIKGFIVSFLASTPDPEKDSMAVQNFLAQTEASFRAHPLWAGATEEELESAGEGLEKYLLTKVFARAFGPVPEDAEKDRLLSKRMAALQHFLRPEHLDIPASFGNEPSWLLAQKELGKMGGYKAPRDKLVCILNCCRVINNLLLNMAMAAQGNPPGADDFLPVLIYVVIKANPPALYSNLMYIQRYRSASRLVSESAYFFTNAVSAASFIEHLNPSSLSMDPADFEAKMWHALTQTLPPPEAPLPPSPPGKAVELPPRHNRSHSEGENSPGLGKQPSGMSNSESSPALAMADVSAGGVPARTLAPPPSPGLTVSPADSASAPLTQPGDTVADLEARGTAALVSAAESGQLAREYRFLYSSVGDLRVGDVEALLTEYKELVLKYEALARGLQERNAGLARQLNVTKSVAEESSGGRNAGQGQQARAMATGEGVESKALGGGEALLRLPEGMKLSGAPAKMDEGNVRDGRADSFGAADETPGEGRAQHKPDQAEGHDNGASLEESAGGSAVSQSTAKHVVGDSKKDSSVQQANSHSGGEIAEKGPAEGKEGEAEGKPQGNAKRRLQASSEDGDLPDKTDNDSESRLLDASAQVSVGDTGKGNVEVTTEEVGGADVQLLASSLEHSEKVPNSANEIGLSQGADEKPDEKVQPADQHVEHNL